jgi:protein-L-isoaspartate(D-aspartate) O-methyltransferase
VPRHLFLPESLRAAAYSDRRIVLEGGRSLLPPLILARLIQALQPQAGETALDLFGATGYSAAILADLGLAVTMLEPEAALAGLAGETLKASGASIASASGTVSAAAVSGLSGGPFDVILVNGATEVEPTALFALMKEGGRLAIIRRSGSAAQAQIYLKSHGTVGVRPAFDAQAPLLPGFTQEPGFVF